MTASKPSWISVALGSCVLRDAPPQSFGAGGARAAIRYFSWVIDSWDAAKVAARIGQARPQSGGGENKGAFQSFWVKDLDGWDLQISD